MCALAAVVGPAVAILIIPRQTWFPIADLDFYFRAQAGKPVWLQRLDAGAFGGGCRGNGSEATTRDQCPAGGFQAIMAWSTNLAVTDFQNDMPPFGNPVYQGTYITQVEARTGARGRGAGSGASHVWQVPLGVAEQFMYVQDQWTVASLALGGFDKRRYRHWLGTKRRAMVKTKVPYTHSVCLARQQVAAADTRLAFPLPDSDVYRVRWQAREVTKRFDMDIAAGPGGIGREWAQWADTAVGNATAPALNDTRVRLQWLPADPSHPDPARRASARAVVYMPTDPGTTPTAPATRGAYACTLFSWWADADIVFSISVTPFLPHRAGDRVYTGTIDADDFRNALADEQAILSASSPSHPLPELISLTPVWLDALTPPLPDSAPRTLTFERIAENALVGHPEKYNNDIAKEGTAVEMLLGIVVNDGISRTGTGVNIIGLEYKKGLSPAAIGRTFLTGPSPIMNPCTPGSAYLNSTKLTPEECNVGTARLILQVFGWGHLMGKTIVACLAVVTLHVAFAVAHFCWVVLGH